MKICPHCHTENEDDAIFCKKCATRFDEDDEQTDKKKNNDKSKVKKQKKVKQKVKTKYKTEVKREKAPKEKQKSSFFSKFLVFILLIIVIAFAGALGVLGYHYYQENNIEVPDVVGYSYKEATSILSNSKLSYQQKEELTTDQSEVGVVIKQSKRAGSKTHENAVITLTVGVLDTHVKVPDVRGMQLDDALNSLNKAGISYQLVYEESDEDENTILKQSVRPGKEIENTESVILTVSKKVEQIDDSQNSPEKDSSTNENNSSVTNTDETDSSIGE